ncbi:MAG: hypothetical protein K6G83_08305 [Lachnospiraceae bacterium]|nr:hypothetical protein [Lachnospiraceae bacterium]
MRISNVNGSASLDGVSRLDTVCGQLILHREGEAIHQKVDLDGVAVSSGVSGGYVWYVGDDCPDLTLKEGKVYLGDVCIDGQNTTITDGKDIFYAGGTKIFRYGNFVSFGENHFNLNYTPGVLTCASRKDIGWDCNCQKDANGDCVSCYSQNGDTLTVCGETIHLGQYIFVGYNFVCLGDKYLYDFTPASEGSTDPDYTKMIDVAFDADSHILTVAGYAINVGTRPICWLDSVDVVCAAGVYYPTMNNKIFKPCAYVKYRTGDYCYSVARQDYVTIPYSSALSIQCDPQYKVGDPIEIGLTVRGCVDGYGNTDGRGARGDITVFLDNKSERRLVNDNPSFTYVYDPGDLAEGPHQLCVILDGDETHAGATATATFTVVRTDPVLKLTGKQDTKGEEFENGAKIEYDPETPIVINAINDAAVSDTSWKWQLSNTSAADAVELGETTNNSGNNAVNSEDISLYTVGLGTVKLWAGFSGNGKYKPAKAAISFSVVPRQVTNPIIEVLNEDELYYDGTAKEPEVRVYYASGKLIPADQYDVTYSDNTNASGENSKAKVIVKSKAGALYTIDATKEFMIQGSVPVIEELPAASAISYGQTLEDSTFSGGKATVDGNVVTGTFAWKDTTIAPVVSGSETTEYEVIFTPESANYLPASCKVKLKVNKADVPSSAVTAPMPKTGLSYTGEALELADPGSVTAGFGTMYYALTESDVTEAPEFDGDSTSADKKWSTSIPAAKNAGTYKVWYKVVGDGNHNDTAAAGPVSVGIDKVTYNGTKEASANVRSDRTTSNATLTLPALPDGAAYAASGTVDGTTPALIDGTPSVSGNTLTYSTTSQADQTSAAITIGATGAKNYNDYDVVVTITARAKDDAGVTINGGSREVTYGTQGISLKGTAANPGIGNKTWEWSSDPSTVAEINKDTGAVTIKSTGTATITAKYESETTIGEASITLKVNKKPVTITGVTASDKEYDGNATAAITSAGHVNGVVSGDDVSADITNAAAVFNDKNVGRKTATFKGFRLSGTAAGNYELSGQPAGMTAYITQKAVTATATAINRSYEGGNTTVSLTNWNLPGIISGDKVSLNKDGATGRIADPNAGTKKPVTVSGATLAGEDRGNYSLTQPAGVTVTISRTSPTPNMPERSVSVAETVAKVSQVSLPSSWAWSESDQDKDLIWEQTVYANAVYTGADKGNYVTETVSIGITRAPCTHGSTETRNSKGANCSETGYTGDVYCRLCGKLIKSGETIPTNDSHNYESKVTKEPTKLSDGVMTYTCSRCHKSYTQAIPRLQGSEDYGDLLKDVDTGDGKTSVEEKTKTGKDENGNPTQETTITIGGEEVEKTIVNEETGEEKIETKLWVSGISGSYTYTGAEIKPEVHVYDGTKKLTLDKDYKVDYSGNKNGGTATVKVSFKGNYASTEPEELHFSITPAVLGTDVVAADLGVAKTKKAQTPVPSIRFAASGTKLDASLFAVSYAPAEVKEEGTYTATITPKDTRNFTGSMTATITVTADKKVMLSKGKVTISPKTCTYTGKAIVPAPSGYKLTLNGKTLTYGKDYEVSEILNNVNPGTATVVFTAVEENADGYVGSITGTFTIKKETASAMSIIRACPMWLPA